MRILKRILRTRPILSAVVWPTARTLTRRVPRVLMYHRFGPGEDGRKTSVATLRRNIEVLREWCELVTFAELIKRKGRASGKPLAAITVDDGYRDFHTYALPALTELGAPATIFVAAGFVRDQIWLWPDAVRYLIFHPAARPGSITIGGAAFDIVLDSPASREQSWDRIATAVLYDNVARAAAIAGLQKVLGVDLPASPPAEYGPMLEQELREVAEAGIEVGGHTWSHSFLPQLSPGELRRELVEAREYLEQVTGRKVRSFAYPNGQPPDFPDALVAEVQRAGYLGAAVAVRPVDTALDPFRVGRWCIGDDPVQMGNVLSGASMLRTAIGAAS